MTALRPACSVTDPAFDARQPTAALTALHDGGVPVRAPSRDLPAAARAKVERVLRDLEGAVPLDPLPLGAGAEVVGGAVLAAPVPPVRRPRGRAAPSPTGPPEMRAPVHLARCARLRPSTRERAVAGRRGARGGRPAAAAPLCPGRPPMIPLAAMSWRDARTANLPLLARAALGADRSWGFYGRSTELSSLDAVGDACVDPRERKAQDPRSGAGQPVTPRPLTDARVAAGAPRAGGGPADHPAAPVSRPC